MDTKKIVNSLTNEQLAKYIRGDGFWYLFSNPELGVKKVKMSDGPHGLRTEPDKKEKDKFVFATTYKAICFPSMSLAACSFNKDLIYRLGETLAEEAKHLGVHIILGPAVNIKRDPKCGRNFEYISEDPYVVGELATAYINGVQSHGIGTSIKHFACNNCETDRMVINSVVDERALREIYLLGFEKAIKNSQPYTVMASYNKLNGVYTTESYHLLTEILRDEWRFEGFVVSDWTAIDNINAAVLAGMDLEMPEAGSVHYQDSLNGINSDEKIKEAYKTSIERQLKIINKTIDLSPDFVFDYETDHKLAKEIADESIILLKNEDNILPLNTNEKVLFVGALAEEPRYQGGGSSNINPFKVTKMSELIKNNPNILYSQGYVLNEDRDDEKLLNDAIEKAKTVDKIVCFLGFNVTQESEGFDKQNLKLYSNQINLIEVLQRFCKNIIVILQNGSVVELPFIDKVKGLLETFLGGEAINESIYDILYGKVNPSGRLNETFAKIYEDYPSSVNFPGNHINIYYKESIFVGYRYFDTFKKDVVFPFGYGLSYSEFVYENLKIQTLENHLKVELDVKNNSAKDGKEVVQIYIKNAAKPGYFIENKALKAFKKVGIKANETKTISFEIPYEDIKIYDISTDKFVLLNGKYRVFASKHSLDESLYANFEITQGQDEIYEYKNIDKFLSGNFKDVSNDDFKELFINKTLPEATRDLSTFDINSSFNDAIEKGSRGAKRVINFLSKLKMFKEDPILLTFLKTSSIRQIYCGGNGKLTRKDMQIFVDLLNDKHINLNFIRLLLALAKMA